MTLDITQQDIDHATQDDWDNCPIARACRRVIPEARVQVFDGVIIAFGKRYCHTEESEFFAKQWDYEPERFEPRTIELPDFRKP